MSAKSWRAVALKRSYAPKAGCCEVACTFLNLRSATSQDGARAVVRYSLWRTSPLLPAGTAGGPPAPGPSGVASCKRTCPATMNSVAADVSRR